MFGSRKFEKKNMRERKYKRKIEGNNKRRKIKNAFQINKLLLYVFSNSFHLFSFIYKD